MSLAAVLSLLAPIAGALALAGCGDKGAEGGDCPPGARSKTASGFCVPRWVVLKRDDVIARKGPGADYEALFTYHAKGLPVQVVAETADWRRICDPDGGAVWVGRIMVDGKHNVMARGKDPLALRRAPKADSPVAGLVNARALASLEDCKAGWCRVKVGGVSGWAPADALWGTQTAAQCR